MNVPARLRDEPTQLARIDNADAIRVLQNSLYPGARPESVELVLAWCRSTGRDPMKKPIHIVPMWVKDAATGQGGMRDVLMPGIGTYRTDAASSGQYAGKGEPEFGPDVTRKLDGIEVTFPQWCRVTVKRMVGGHVRDFTAKEFWLENYATAKRDSDAPNAMWKKRPYGQLAKCAESQALRMAFPDETGNTNTAEEMEGKSFEGMTLDAKPEPVALRAEAPTIPDFPATPKLSVRDLLRDALAASTSRDDVADAATLPAVAKILRDGPEKQREVLQAMLSEAFARFPLDEPPADDPDAERGDLGGPEAAE